MSEAHEVVTIAVSDNAGGKCVRAVTDEFNSMDTCWPNLVQVFLEQLQGLGYSFVVPTEELAGVLDKYHHGACMKKHKEDFKEEEPKQEGKYPYAGVTWSGRDYVVVRFTEPNTGVVISSNEHQTGYYSKRWYEGAFKKVDM